MTTQEIQQNTSLKIKYECCELNEKDKIPLMLTFAEIESTMGIKLNRRGSQFKGVFQIGSDYPKDKRYEPHCSNCDFMYDIKCSLICVLAANKIHKHIWDTYKDYQWKEKGKWEEWFYYGIHQQGLEGFRNIYKKVTKNTDRILATTHENINNNKPTKLKKENLITTEEWFYGWQEEFNEKFRRYNKVYDCDEIKEKYKFLKQLSNPQPEKIEPKDIRYNPPIEKPKSKHRMDLEKAQAHYAFYEKLKAEGLYGTPHHSYQAAKERAAKRNKVDRSYEPRQYIHPALNYVNPATANINVPVDENGDFIGGVEIDSGKIKEGVINVDRQNVMG